MAKKKKTLMYEMYCEDCKEPAVKDEEKSSDSWTVFQMKCTKCGGRIKIDTTKPYYI